MLCKRSYKIYQEVLLVLPPIIRFIWSFEIKYVSYIFNIISLFDYDSDFITKLLFLILLKYIIVTISKRIRFSRIILHAFNKIFGIIHILIFIGIFRKNLNIIFDILVYIKCLTSFFSLFLYFLESYFAWEH